VRRLRRLYSQTQAIERHRQCRRTQFDWVGFDEANLFKVSFSKELFVPSRMSVIDCQCIGIIRRLCLLSFDPIPNDFLRGVGRDKIPSETISRYVNAPDRGTVFRDTSSLQHLQAIQLLHYLIAQSPRLNDNLLRIMDMERLFEA
jgi:hypothetical protein